MRTLDPLATSEKLVKMVDFSFVAEAVQTPDKAAGLARTFQPGEQVIIPGIVDGWRRQGIPGTGLADSTFAGALFATAAEGDLSGIVIGVRTGPPGGGGQ